MPNWRDNLVEAFPIPEDRRPGWRTRAKKEAARKEALGITAEDEASALSDTLLTLSLNNPSLDHTKGQPFPFLDLPLELRQKIYKYLLFSPATFSRQQRRYYRIGSKTSILLASHQTHTEASHILYTSTPFAIFPLQEFDAAPTIDQLLPHYRSLVRNLSLTFGPSWTAPPKSWRVTPALGRVLRRLDNVETLRIWVQFDPSHPSFSMHRISEGYYTNFCGLLLWDVLNVMLGLKRVVVDGNSSVKKAGPLVSRVVQVAQDKGVEIKWGPKSGWASEPDLTGSDQLVDSAVSRSEWESLLHDAKPHGGHGTSPGST